MRKYDIDDKNLIQRSYVSCQKDPTRHDVIAPTHIGAALGLIANVTGGLYHHAPHHIIGLCWSEEATSALYHHVIFSCVLCWCGERTEVPQLTAPEPVVCKMAFGWCYIKQITCCIASYYCIARRACLVISVTRRSGRSGSCLLAYLLQTCLPACLCCLPACLSPCLLVCLTVCQLVACLLLSAGSTLLTKLFDLTEVPTFIRGGMSKMK